VDCDNPVMELVKIPAPAPLIVLVDNAIVGKVLVLHTTPLLIMYEPPSSIMLPPDIADVFPIELILVVDITGNPGATYSLFTSNMVRCAFDINAKHIKNRVRIFFIALFFN